jgi:hypothetical protein
MLPEPANTAEVELIVPREALRLSADQALRGTIFFRKGSIEFPTNDWDDFVVVLLEWWLRALMPIVRGEEASAEFLFMEGPYQVNVEAISPTMIVLQFFDRSNPEFLESDQGEQTLSDLTHQLCDASDVVIDRAKGIGLQNRDLDRLHTTLAEMRVQTNR